MNNPVLPIVFACTLIALFIGFMHQKVFKAINEEMVSAREEVLAIADGRTTEDIEMRCASAVDYCAQAEPRRQFVALVRRKTWEGVVGYLTRSGEQVFSRKVIDEEYYLPKSAFKAILHGNVVLRSRRHEA